MNSNDIKKKKIKKNGSKQPCTTYIYRYIHTQSCRGPWRKMRECGTKRILTDASQCRLRFETTTIRNRCSRSPSRLPRYHHGTTWWNTACCRYSAVAVIKKLLTDYSIYSVPQRDQSGGGMSEVPEYRLRSSIITGIQNRDRAYMYSRNGLIIILFYTLFTSRRFLHDKINIEKLIILLFYVYF